MLSRIAGISFLPILLSGATVGSSAAEEPFAVGGYRQFALSTSDGHILSGLVASEANQILDSH